MRRLISILPLTGMHYADEKISFDDHLFHIFEPPCLNYHNPEKTRPSAIHAVATLP